MTLKKKCQSLSLFHLYNAKWSIKWLGDKREFHFLYTKLESDCDAVVLGGSAVLQGCLAAWPWWWPTSWRWRAEAGWSLWPPWGRRGPVPDQTWASCGSWRSLRTQNWERWAVNRQPFLSLISGNDATSKVTDWTMTKPGSGFRSAGFTSTRYTSRLFKDFYEPCSECSSCRNSCQKQMGREAKLN